MSPQPPSKVLAPRPGLTLSVAPTPSPDFASLPRRRAPPATAACLACRKRKIRCTAERPSCAACRGRGDRCQYDAYPTETPGKALKRKYEAINDRNAATERVYRLLQTRSDGEAGEILRRIRTGIEPESVLRLIENGDMLMELAVFPGAQLRYEFPFLTSMPRYLCSSSNEYLKALLCETAFLDGPGQLVNPVKVAKPEDDESRPYLRPFHAATIIDPRLNAVKPSNWTTVSEDDELMRRALHCYFLYDYVSFCSFHKDHFLDDMLSGGRKFCSPLLVNAVLAHACHSSAGPTDRGEYWNPRSLAYQFLAEARRLWDLELGKNRLTTVQAGPILYLTNAICGADNVGRSYLIQSVAMAQNMGMFGSDGGRHKGKMQHVRDFTAWAIFWCQSHATWYFNTAPFLDEPPKCPLPEPRGGRDWYGDIWIKYPSSTALYSTRFGFIVYAQTKLNVIINEMSQQFFGTKGKKPALSLADLAHHYQRMSDWYDDLPEQLKPRKIVFPSHLNMHMHYFLSLIRLLNTAAALIQLPPQDLKRSGWTKSKTPQEFLLAATTSLETLLRVYYLRHSFEQLDTFLLQPLLEVASLRQKEVASAKTSAESESMHATLVLCVQGFRDQGQHHFLGRTLLQLMRSSLPANVVALADKHLYADHDSHKVSTNVMANQIHSNWPVNIAGDSDDPEMQRLSAVLRRLEGVDLDSASEAGSSGEPEDDRNSLIAGFV